MASFSGLKTIGKDLLDYMMSHRPLPDEELSMGLHDLNEVFPGIYGKAAKNYKTGAGDKIDREALDAIMTAKGNPDAMIDIYRAVPKGVKDFNVGDWVTTSKSYAKHHGEGPLKGEYDLITTKARASDIAEPGDSIAEQGYWGPKVTGSLTKGYLPFGIGLGTLASAGFLPDTEASAKSAYINSPEMKAAMMGIHDEPVKEAWNPVEALATAPIGAFTTGARAASVGIDALLSALLGD